MDSHFNRQIHLIEDGKSWSLKELDESGSQIGTLQKPFSGVLEFTSSELRLYNSLAIETPYQYGSAIEKLSITYDREAFENEFNDINEELKNSGEQEKEVSESEAIFGTLHSGVCDDDGQKLTDSISYSMLGTDRKIEDFTIFIKKLDDENGNEYCGLWGGSQYEEIESAIQITIHLAPKRFDRLATIIRLQRADIISITLNSCRGVYSDKDAVFNYEHGDYSIKDIKILASGKYPKVIIPEGCQIEPKRLGYVYSFNLKIIQRNKLNLKQDLRPINVEKLFKNLYEDEELELESFAKNEPDVNALLLAAYS